MTDERPTSGPTGGPTASGPAGPESIGPAPIGPAPIGPEPISPEPTSAEPEGTVSEVEVSIRRAPRYPTFLILGAGLGAVVTFILTASFRADPAVGFGALFGYFAIYGVPTGALLGAVVALILDRVSSRRARTITVAHTTVDPLPIEGEIVAD